MPKDNLADAMAKAESVQKQMRGKNLKISFSFVFKKSTFWNNKEFYTDEVERNLMFHQVCSFCTFLQVTGISRLYGG